jgi:SMC interacting uncharacterized protein involved in chromosome segregation
MSIAMSSVTGFGCESRTIGSTITAATTSAIAPTRRRRARCFSGRVGSRSSASDSGRSVRRVRRSTRSARSVRTFREARYDRRAAGRVVVFLAERENSHEWLSPKLPDSQCCCDFR